ncbi:hypothetical protein GMRT_12706 [Giardia muris]|uniref:Uncharacterized protein n=1 Tax=Giardia muris TaxID=5742 RepID=A0A4Z1TD84_GIAMU|nr:hypothetical protein GMRT_12706 [Giardia muris]|eukprot:TNJ30499.1 hypothetical protein GMRT_12706 [Giardia muris]
MSSLLVSALEKENQALLSRITKLESQLRLNDASYVRTHASVALSSHVRTAEDLARIKALEETIQEMDAEIMSLRNEREGLYLKCTEIEKAFKKSEEARHLATAECTRLVGIVAQYEACCDLLAQAIRNQLSSVSGTQVELEENENHGFLTSLPLHNESKGMRGLNIELERLVSAIPTNRNLSCHTTQHHMNEHLQVELERLKAEVITARAHAAAEAEARKNLQTEARNSILQLRDLQNAQLEVRDKRIAQLEMTVKTLEQGLRRKDEQLTTIQNQRKDNESVVYASSYNEHIAKVEQETTEQFRVVASRVIEEVSNSKAPTSSSIQPNSEEAFHHLPLTASVRRSSSSRRPTIDSADDLLRLASGRRLSNADITSTVNVLMSQ